MKRSLVLVVVAVLIVAAVVVIFVRRESGEGRYPDDVRDRFLQNCRPGGGDLLCACVLDELEDEYTLDEFRALEPSLYSESPPPFLDGIVRHCVVKESRDAS